MIQTILKEIKIAHPNFSKAIAIGVAALALIFTIDALKEPRDKKLEKISKELQVAYDNYEEQLNHVWKETSKLQSTINKLESNVTKKENAIRILSSKSKKDQAEITNLNKSIQKLKSDHRAEVKELRAALALAKSKPNRQKVTTSTKKESFLTDNSSDSVLNSILTQVRGKQQVYLGSSSGLGSSNNDAYESARRQSQRYTDHLNRTLRARRGY